jgi:hypothetical protein
LGAQAIMTGTEANLFDTLGARGHLVTVSAAEGQSQVQG